MTIAIDVAKAEGWRNKMFPPWRDCRDIPNPAADIQAEQNIVVEKTLGEVLDATKAYAKKLRRKVLNDLKKYE